MQERHFGRLFKIRSVGIQRIVSLDTSISSERISLINICMRKMLKAIKNLRMVLKSANNTQLSLKKVVSEDY